MDLTLDGRQWLMLLKNLVQMQSRMDAQEKEMIRYAFYF